jgi:hypothetical protein
MKQGTITSIAATMMQDFARTVEVAEKAQADLITGVAAAQSNAIQTRQQRQVEIDEKRREGGELIAESLRLEQDANAEFDQAMALTIKELHQCSGEKIADAAKLKLISNKKVA